MLAPNSLAWMSKSPIFAPFVKEIRRKSSFDMMFVLQNFSEGSTLIQRDKIVQIARS